MGSRARRRRGPRIPLHGQRAARRRRGGGHGGGRRLAHDRAPRDLRGAHARADGLSRRERCGAGRGSGSAWLCRVLRRGGGPVRALSLAFLGLLAVTVAATSQITGVLLVFALLVAPAAAAQALTTRPLLSLALSVALALAIAWLGLAISYFSIYPAGFFIST